MINTAAWVGLLPPPQQKNEKTSQAVSSTTTLAEGRGDPAAAQVFWSTEQRFFKNLCVSMKVRLGRGCAPGGASSLPSMGMAQGGSRRLVVQHDAACCLAYAGPPEAPQPQSTPREMRAEMRAMTADGRSNPPTPTHTHSPLAPTHTHPHPLAACTHPHPIFSQWLNLFRCHS